MNSWFAQKKLLLLSGVVVLAFGIILVWQSDLIRQYLIRQDQLSPTPPSEVTPQISSETQTPAPAEEPVESGNIATYFSPTYGIVFKYFTSQDDGHIIENSFSQFPQLGKKQPYTQILSWRFSPHNESGLNPEAVVISIYDSAVIKEQWWSRKTRTKAIRVDNQECYIWQESIGSFFDEVEESTHYSFHYLLACPTPSGQYLIVFEKGDGDNQPPELASLSLQTLQFLFPNHQSDSTYWMPDQIEGFAFLFPTYWQKTNALQWSFRPQWTQSEARFLPWPEEVQNDAYDIDITGWTQEYDGSEPKTWFAAAFPISQWGERTCTRFSNKYPTYQCVFTINSIESIGPTGTNENETSEKTFYIVFGEKTALVLSARTNTPALFVPIIRTFIQSIHSL